MEVALAFITLAGAYNAVGDDESQEEVLSEEIVRSRTELAKFVSLALLRAYKAGEIDLPQLLDLMAPLSHNTLDPIGLLGKTFAAAHAIGKPKYLGHKKPLYPAWFKDLAVDLVVLLHDPDATDWPLIPPTNSRGHSTLGLVSLLLSVLELYTPARGRGINSRSPVTPLPKLPVRTLHTWYLSRVRAEGTSSRRGRPARQSPDLAAM